MCSKKLYDKHNKIYWLIGVRLTLISTHLMPKIKKKYFEGDSTLKLVNIHINSLNFEFFFIMLNWWLYHIWYKTRLWYILVNMKQGETFIYCVLQSMFAYAKHYQTGNLTLPSTCVPTGLLLSIWADFIGKNTSQSINAL
jgi:hypothetical protein